MFDSLVMPDAHRLKSAEVQASSFIDEVIDHSKRSWSNVLHGKSTLAENVEVGTEAVLGAVAVAMAAKFGLSKSLSAEKYLPEGRSIIGKAPAEIGTKVVGAQPSGLRREIPDLALIRSETELGEAAKPTLPRQAQHFDPVIPRLVTDREMDDLREKAYLAETGQGPKLAAHEDAQMMSNEMIPNPAHSRARELLHKGILHQHGIGPALTAAENAEAARLEQEVLALPGWKGEPKPVSPWVFLEAHVRNIQ